MATSEESVPSGAEALTAEELELLKLLDQGLGVGDIARRLSASKQTISARKASVMRKLGVANDAALFVAIAERGLLP